MTNAPQIITKTYDFLLYLIPQIAKFPRSERYLVGERLETCCFDVFELLLTSAYSREKILCLQRANVRLDQARHRGDEAAHMILERKVKPAW